MQTQAYFDDIQLHILHELGKATSSIHIAVAWFTDPDIFEHLCRKAGSGVRVELLVKPGLNQGHSPIFADNFIQAGAAPTGAYIRAYAIFLVLQTAGCLWYLRGTGTGPTTN